MPCLTVLRCVQSTEDPNLSTQVGPFRACWRVDMGAQGSLSDCEDVNSHCAFIKGDGETTVPVAGNCDEFNAARAFQVISGLIFAVLALMFQLFVVCKPIRAAPRAVFILRRGSAVLGMLAGACGLISMALWLNLADNESTSLGDGFWMLMGDGLRGRDTLLQKVLKE